MRLELTYLSKYRTELMGISTIMILICHAPINGVIMPKYLEYLLVQGQIGVDIFLFVSGMGLWYSLSKIEAITYAAIKRWYINRYVKILVPYLLIQGFLTAVQCSMDDSLGFLYWLSNVSTIEFWISHRAAWFIALLLPLYLIAPALFLFLQKKTIQKFVGILIVVYFVSLFPLDVVGIKADYNNVFYNIQFTMIRVPSFILGMFMAPFIKRGATIKASWVIPMLLGALIVFTVTRTPIDTYLFLVLPVMFFWVFFFTIKESAWFNKVCRFFGGISLESYLWNGLRVVIVPFMTFLSIPDHNNILMYSLVLIVGTILSVFVGRIKKPIIQRIAK